MQYFQLRKKKPTKQTSKPPTQYQKLQFLLCFKLCWVVAAALIAGVTGAEAGRAAALSFLYQPCGAGAATCDKDMSVRAEQAGGKKRR